MGFKVIIAGAGGAAHLPGMIASFTTIPVIGVPILVYNDKQAKKTDSSKFSAVITSYSIHYTKLYDLNCKNDTFIIIYS